MKKLIIVLMVFFIAISSAAQQMFNFPKSQQEDKTNIMSEAYWEIWNPDVQAQIDADIEKNRKANGFIHLENVRNGTEVRIEQISHDFIFGASIFNFNQLGTVERNEKYKAVFGTLFNSATVPFYWRTFELEQDRMRFVTEEWDSESWWNTRKEPYKYPHWRRPSTDQIVDFCEKKGIRAHGHVLTWGNRKWQHPDWLENSVATEAEKNVMDGWISEYADLVNYNSCDLFTKEYEKMTEEEIYAAIPQYIDSMSALMKDRIEIIAKRYGSRLQSWDVANESSKDYGLGRMIPGSKVCKSRYGIMPGDYTYESFQLAQSVFPEDVALNINDYNLVADYGKQINDLLERGCKIDIAGAQMHLFNPQQCLDISMGAEIQTPEIVYEWYDMLSAAGLPIHLSEITITSPNDDESGRMIQAVITQNLYRLWFSLENLMGITWWNLVDNCGAPGEPSVSGIFTREMVAKPSYYALDNLLNNEWKTSLKAKADKNGNIEFRGFKGNYRVSWIDVDGNVQTKEYYLK